MGNLNILKASAGSGKTHNLTREYLRLLFKSDSAYKHILAVTFTNKATDEMKRRVLEELFKMSASDPVAKKRLITILHDYSSFSISTIDRFFQQTMRAFAREIGKNSSYSVELDQDMVLAEAIDQMILNLDKEESSELLDWLISYSYDSIESGKSWDIKKGIKELAEQIFKEAFKIKNIELGDKLTGKKELAAYKKVVGNIILKFENQLIDIGKRALKIIERNNLVVSDFKGGSRSPLNYFSKIASGATSAPTATFKELLDNQANWYKNTLTKTDPSLCHSIENAYDDGLNDLVRQIVNMAEEWREYNSAKVTGNNIYSLGILLDINKYIQKYSKENNVVLLSETTELLNQIIDGSDTPFIYEKVGSRIDNFMLDEFQDTSLMQWQNFKPLIQNSLAAGNDNLIVGDVKQSIYRWRGSDWNLLNSDVYNDFDNNQIKEKQLTENWRSSENIVKFNNDFFTYAAAICDNILGESEISTAEVYNEVKQTVAEQRNGNEGHVQLKFIENEDGESWHESVLNKIAPSMDKLLENGYKYNDIAFLVRKNSEGVEIVNFLIDKGYPVISDEALLISSSKSVMKIVTILRYCNNPKDPINNLIADYENITLSMDNFPEHLPLYEMCEKIVCDWLGDIDLSEAAFVQGFLDTVLDYVKNNRSDLASFLEWWNEKSSKISLSSPEGQDAIKVMTIHKAKGLGMKVVIVPFFEITLDHSSQKRNIIWCEPNVEPFNGVPFIPIVYGKNLQETIYAKDYQRERQKAFIDNLNTAYVAFTRAKKELLVFARRAKKPEEPKSVSDILYRYYKDELDEKQEICIGDWSLAGSQNLIPVNEIELTDFRSIPIGDRLKLSLNSSDFFDKSSKRNFGLIMHDVLSRVFSEKDLPDSIKFSVKKGELKEEEYAAMLLHMNSMLESVRDRHWFDGACEVLNELEIIEPGGRISRPDRVLIGSQSTVIDFKFGSQKSVSHERQVARYMSLISGMGIEPVKGYLWYLEDNEIIEVV
ncbi:MAG: UvrD-helicase domain-containing protein [Bacteroidales bacterium]|jgi:ATP-dependent exoDNAse (exonuclease V) beta subunit